MAKKLNANSPKAPPARGSVLGDNSEALLRAEEAQLISIVHRLRREKSATELAKKPYDDARAAEAETYRVAKLAGFSKIEVNEYLADAANPNGREVSDREAKRARRRRFLGLPVGELQPELDDKLPEEAKDELYYAGEGYRSGLSGGARDAPAGTPPRMIPIWLGNYDKGHDEATRLISANAPAPMHPKAAAVRAQAAADFAADDPEARFEASAEEIEAQKPRQAIVDAKEGKTSGEVL